MTCHNFIKYLVFCFPCVSQYISYNWHELVFTFQTTNTGVGVQRGSYVDRWMIKGAHVLNPYTAQILPLHRLVPTSACIVVHSAHEGLVECTCFQLASICLSQGKLEEKYRSESLDIHVRTCMCWRLCILFVWALLWMWIAMIMYISHRSVSSDIKKQGEHWPWSAHGVPGESCAGETDVLCQLSISYHVMDVSHVHV